MTRSVHPARALTGALIPPPDKAICHRLLLLAAVADGETVMQPRVTGADCRRTQNVVEALGVAVEELPTGMRIHGRGTQGLTASRDPLPCGESGTTLRLAAGLLAGHPFRSILTAEASLRPRPMRRIVEPLTQMGARVEGVLDPTTGDVHPPLTIHGRRPLRALRYALPVASAQVKSAVLLAGLAADGPTTVIEAHPTRDHTERALRLFGATVRREGAEVTVSPGALRAPGVCEVPADPSSAAFFVVAAAARAGSEVEVRGVGCNPSRLGYLDVLRRMGADVQVDAEHAAWEPRGTLRVRGGALRAVTVEADEVPGLIDELPALMVAAAVAQGTSRFRGLRELRVKETDRVRSMLEGLAAFGAQVRPAGDDGVEIVGGRLRGARVSGAGDHRTVMSLAAAALLAEDGPTVIEGSEAVAKSYPAFFDDLAALTGGADAEDR